MKAYSITDIGKKRSMNQDYVYASDQPVGNLKNLLIVADGMGGHNAGDLASRYTVQEMLTYIKESEEDRPVPLLSMAIHHANEQVLEKAESEKELTEKFIENHPNIEFYQLDGRVMLTAKKGLTVKYEKLKCFFKQEKWIRKFLKENKVDIVMFSYVTQLLLVPIFKRYGIKTVFN